MRTKVYFVRHAQSDFSVKDEMIRPLTLEGKKCARKIIPVLKRKKIETIYSSPCIRSIDTVKCFAEKYGLPIRIDEGFAERKIGTWIEDFHTYSIQQWHDFNYKLTNGESLKETQDRNIAALRKIIQTHQNENVIIATHGTALATIVNYFYPDHGYDYFVSIVDKMPYILCLTFHNGAIEWMEEIEMNFALT